MTAPGPSRARCLRTAPLGLLLALTGCAAALDVRPLATERADQPAFELTGRDLAALRREAGLLCPKGGEILRQSAREQRLEAVDSRLARWAHYSSQWITPSERHAQMVVLCNPLADRQWLPQVSAVPSSAAVLAAGAASAPGLSAVLGAALAPVPVGPLAVEW